MSAGRWRVYRTNPKWLMPWVAVPDAWIGSYGNRTVTFKAFPTWREAYTYADKQARR